MVLLRSTLFLLLAVVALISAEVVDFHTCEPADVEACTINEVRVDPCPQALNHAPCHVRRRKQSIISFDYTPNFDAETLYADLVWQKSATEELPLVTMDHAACNSTPCPVRSGVKQTYQLNVPIESKFPLSSYRIKWTFKDPNSGKRCCFAIDIKIKR